MRETKPIKFSKECQWHITRLFHWCMELHNIGHWGLTLSWYDVTPNDDHVMSCNVDTSYLRLNVRVYPEMQRLWELQQWETMMRYVMHEVCHHYTQPICDTVEWDIPSSGKRAWSQIIESCTQGIVYMAMRLLREKENFAEMLTPEALEIAVNNQAVKSKTHWELPLVEPIDDYHWTYDTEWKR